jgi:hypothetical protein
MVEVTKVATVLVVQSMADDPFSCTYFLMNDVDNKLQLMQHMLGRETKHMHGRETKLMHIFVKRS